MKYLGLFRQAISLSGTSLSLGIMTSSETAKERAQALAIMTGCPHLETKKMVECLKEVPAKMLTIYMKNFFVSNRRTNT